MLAAQVLRRSLLSPHHTEPGQAEAEAEAEERKGGWLGRLAGWGVDEEFTQIPRRETLHVTQLASSESSQTIAPAASFATPQRPIGYCAAAIEVGYLGEEDQGAYPDRIVQLIYLAAEPSARSTLLSSTPLRSATSGTTAACPRPCEPRRARAELDFVTRPERVPIAMSMERRIYFAFPEPRQARSAVSELLAAGIPRTDIHAVALDPQTVSDLPPATAEQRRDLTWSLETTYWRANLALFFLALVGLLAALYAGRPVLAILALAIMVLSFVTGERFAVRVPHAHLDEQRVPLHHGEVVLMVDVPENRVHDVEQVVSRRHPEVGVGGVGWHIHGLNA